MVKIGYLQKRVLMMGKPDRRYSIDSIFNSSLKLKINCGMLYQENSQWIYEKTGSEKRILTETEIIDLFYTEHIGEILIFLNASLNETDIYKFVHFCHENHISCYLVQDINQFSKIGTGSNRFTFIPIIRGYNGSQESLVLLSCKRIFDLVMAIFFLLLSLPLLICISVLIKIEDGGNIFYISKRVGKNGKVFDFYKFRSMIPDAEQKKRELMHHNERPDGPLFKMKNDPRITKIGKILRTLCLDELPQLFNVLKGDLSFVGPRPHLVEEVTAYTQKDQLRLECIPGMSCLPQIYDRNRIGFKQWVTLDIFYRNHWSLFLDFKILLKSIFVMVNAFFFADKK